MLIERVSVCNGFGKVSAKLGVSVGVKVDGTVNGDEDGQEDTDVLEEVEL